MIPTAAWQEHLKKPGCARSLPDGTPLTWTASKADLFEDIAGVFQPQTPHECEIFLWCAQLTTAAMLALWMPGPPQDHGENPLPRFRFQAQFLRAVQWRDATVPLQARQCVMHIVAAIVEREYGGALDPDPATEEPDGAEKKSLSPAPTGSLLPPPPSVPAPETGPASFTLSPSANSSPPMEPGSTPTASPSSPPPPASAETA